VEKQMSAMAQNALLHNMTAELLRGKYGLLKAAISGKS
jgi:flagellar basal body rod protein FlgB